MQRFGLIGCGNMGSALGIGVLRRHPDAQLLGFDVRREATQHLAAQLDPEQRRRFTIVDNAEAAMVDVRACVLAVKPQVLASALAGTDSAEPCLLLSIAAGVCSSSLRALAPRHRWLRAMPNTPASIAEGISVLHVPSDARPEDLVVARTLLAAVGEVVELSDETLMHVVTALSGSGPAFAAMVVEALADGAVAEGMSRALAYRLARETLRGSMGLLRTQHPAELKDAVGSPGGTTMAGLAAAEAAGLRFALIDAVRQATRRSRELGAR